jgi:CheY-like chemotaxis protein
MEAPTILVVDDELADRMLATEVLLEAGYAVVEAQDGGEALRTIERCSPTEDSPSLVLLDVALPQMDGLELCRHLREQQHFQDLLDRVEHGLRMRQQLQAARDEAVSVMALTIGDQLAQPLTILQARLEMAQDAGAAPELMPPLWSELEEALQNLVERFDRLRCVARYKTRQVDGTTLLDLHSDGGSKAHEN